MVSLSEALGSLGVNNRAINAKLLHELTGVEDQDAMRQLSRALIKQHYLVIENGPLGRLGIPMADIRQIPTGTTQPFSGGYITLTGVTPVALVAHRAEVRYVGFVCGDESNEWSASDEPYFIISVFGTNKTGNVTQLFGPCEGVDAGERFPAGSEAAMLTTQAQPPFTISVVAMENDEGSPAEAAGKVKDALHASVALTGAVGVILANPFILAGAAVAEGLVLAFGDIAAAGVSAVLGLGDDLVGADNKILLDWDGQAETWRTPPRIIEPNPFGDTPYNVKLHMGDDEEGKYTVYFNVNIFRVDSEFLPPLP